MVFPRYLSAKEVAKIFDVSVKTIYKKKFKIPGYIYLDGMHLFDEEELFKGLKQLATQPKRTTLINYQTRDKHGLIK